MAAPSGTQWGNVAGSGSQQGRIGIYLSSSSNQTTTTVTCQIWYWTRYRVSDSSNNFYYDWDSYADTSIGSKSISTSGNSGSGWSTGNQVKIGSYTKSFTRGTSSATKYFSARFSGIEYGGGSGSASISFSIGARNKYTITYNANGGSGAPAKQSYYYGYNTTLSKTKPTRPGYEFLGWSLSSTATSASYQPGQTWSGTNANNYTLYAVWKRITYYVTFDAAGGTVEGGITYSKSVNHGDKLGELPVPTRKNYKFLGWYTESGTQATTETVVTGTVTYYARWKIDAVVYRHNGIGWEQTISYIRTADGMKKANVFVKHNGEWMRSVGE